MQPSASDTGKTGQKAWSQKRNTSKVLLDAGCIDNVELQNTLQYRTLSRSDRQGAVVYKAE